MVSVSPRWEGSIAPDDMAAEYFGRAFDHLIKVG